MSPFDVANSLRSTKKYLMGVEMAERDYNAFMVNRALSYHRDSLPYAQEMNMSQGLTATMQYDYLFYSIRQNRSRDRVKWGKKERADDDLLAVMEYYGYSTRRALEVISLLNSDSVSYIKSKVRRAD